MYNNTVVGQREVLFEENASREEFFYCRGDNGSGLHTTREEERMRRRRRCDLKMGVVEMIKKEGRKMLDGSMYLPEEGPGKIFIDEGLIVWPMVGEVEGVGFIFRVEVEFIEFNDPF